MLPEMVGLADDALLMMRTVAGDVASFEALYARHKGPLYRYFARQCGGLEAAGELFSDVWLRIIRTRDRYEPKTTFAIWMYRIAHDCLVDHYRNTGKALTDTVIELADSASPEPPAEDVDNAFASGRWDIVEWDGGDKKPVSDSDAVLSAFERAGRLISALDALPLEQREAFLLREEAGLELAEIAAVTGASQDTVKSRLRNALKKLGEAIGDVVPATDGRGVLS